MAPASRWVAIVVALSAAGLALWLIASPSPDEARTSGKGEVVSRPDGHKAVLPILPAAPDAGVPVRASKDPEAAIAEPIEPVREAPPTPALVWDDVYRVLDGLAKGGLTGEDALRLADALLARVSAAGAPVVSEDGNRLTWTLVDDPELGTLKFTQLKQPGERQYEFEVSGQVSTRPGAYTGQADDGAENSRFSLVLSADAQDQVERVSVLSQVNPTQKLAFTTERGRDMPVGGLLSVTVDGTAWTPLVVQNDTGDDGVARMKYHTLDPVPTTGSVADSRGDALGQRLAHLRGR